MRTALAAAIMAMAGTAGAEPRMWHAGEYVDDSGALVVAGQLDSLGPLHCSGEPATLVVGCDDFGAVLGVRHACGAMGGQQQLEVSTDRTGTRTDRWANDMEAFTPRFDPVPMISEVLAADRTAVRWYTGEGYETAIFATGPAHETFAPVAQSCGWVQ